MSDKKWWKDDVDLEPEFNLQEALERYRDWKKELAPMLEGMKALELQIKNHVLETGETAEVDGAAVTIRKAYDRVSWDGRALKGYAAAHPEINEFKKVSQIKPAAVIKVR